VARRKRSVGEPKLARRETLVLAGVLALGCGFVKVTKPGKIRVTRTVDGKRVSTVHKFSTWDEFVDAVDASASELAATYAELFEKLVSVPPPRTVKLADLGSDFAAHQGDEELDFVAGATAKDPSKFKYVQIGVATYDDFFRSCAEMYAFSYQTDESIRSLRKCASEELGPVADGTTTKDLIADDFAKSLGKTTSETFDKLAKLGSALAHAIGEFVKRAAALVAAAAKLVAGAAANITNPKVLLHLDLVVQGIRQAGEMVGKTAELLGKISAELV
jgi:hypothetical protein